MGKKGSIYIVIALITLALLMLFQYNTPKKVNWFPSYVSTHKIPYGTYVLGDIMQNSFGTKAQQVNVPPFAFLTENTDIRGTYFFVDRRIEFGEAELNAMLDWTSNGNTLFMASEGFEKPLLDTLGLDTGDLYVELDEERSYRHRLVHPTFSAGDGAIFRKDDYATYFKKIDTAKTVVIGRMASLSNDNNLKDNNSKDNAVGQNYFNVVKRQFGDGEIILSTFPKAFTNYFILKDGNKDYTAGLLSYLDGSRNIYMDNHYKSGKSMYTSPMHIFLNTKELKWAYYLVLIGALIYVLFEGKRKQRAIPVVLPLKNQTLAFTRTIADMYYEQKQAKPIAEHKIANFLEYVRSRFHLGTIRKEEEFYANLASRSGHSVEQIERLFAFLEKLRNQETVSDSELKELNASMEKFKKRTKTA